MIRRPPRSTLPYTTLFRSTPAQADTLSRIYGMAITPFVPFQYNVSRQLWETGYNNTVNASVNGGAEKVTYFVAGPHEGGDRSGEPTTVLQLRPYLVYRLLLNDTATTEIYTSLHDALPIYPGAGRHAEPHLRHGDHAVRAVPVQRQPAALGDRVQQHGERVSQRRGGEGHVLRGRPLRGGGQIGRAHDCTPVTALSRIPSSS